MQATAQDVKDFAEEFESLTDSKINLYLEHARNWVSESKWATKQKLGEILMCAHLLTLAKRSKGGTAGPVTSERVGDVNIGYGTVNITGDEVLSTTGYGLQFIELRKTLLITPILV